MATDSTGIIRKIKKEGWFEVAQRGSHVQFKHATKPGRVTVPHPKKDLTARTIRSIERQSGIKVR